MPELYHDINPFGEEYLDGAPKEHLDAEALKVSLSMWLMSKRGDYIDSVEEGGMISELLFKNMTGEKEEEFRFVLQVAFNNYFQNVAQLLSIDIYPDPAGRFTEVEVIYRDLLTGEVDNLAIYPKQELKSKKLITYEVVTFTGENLFTFVKIKKADMLGQKLFFNIDEDSWIWGNSLKLINFSFSDPFFETILSYVNDL